MSVVGIELPINRGHGSPYSMASMSAPSSPGRLYGGFFFSAPASPHGSPSRQLGQTQLINEEGAVSPDFSSEFEFRFSALSIDYEEPVVTADELFSNGQIRPMGPLIQPPMEDGWEEPTTPRLHWAEGSRGRGETGTPSFHGAEGSRGRGETEIPSFHGTEGSRGRGQEKDGSQRRRTRSMSPLRNSFLQETSEACKLEDIEEHKSQSVAKKGKSGSKRWISLKDFLYRSKSEGSGQTQHKHWALSFSSSPAKQQQQHSCSIKPSSKKQNQEGSSSRQADKSKTKTKTVSDLNSGNQGKRNGKVPLSAHELLYTAKRAQAEGQRHKTFLPYRQGLFGFVGFTSKS